MIRSLRLDTLTLIRFFSVALAVMLAAGFGWRVATWSWRVMAPVVPSPVMDLRAETNPRAVATRPWFGTLGGGAAEPAAMAAASGLRLVGILASGRRPAAILGVGGAAPRVFMQGETGPDGVGLVKVATDHVIVRRNGVDERLELPGRATPKK